MTNAAFVVHQRLHILEGLAGEAATEHIRNQAYQGDLTCPPNHRNRLCQIRGLSRTSKICNVSGQKMSFSCNTAPKNPINMM
jgi:hypothetical protein